MSYTYPTDAQSMFEDREHQFVNLGLPAEDVARVRSATEDFWRDGPGGWGYEFSRLAAGYAARGRHDLAALAYGGAKFPCLADDERERAHALQLEEYLKASVHFPVRFERRMLSLPSATGTVELPVHLYSTAESLELAPVLLAHGGVDTWKMDLHSWWVTMAVQAGVTVLAVDMPGTGENPVPLDGEAQVLIDGLVLAARGVGNGLVGHLGTSFGGNFSALTGLSGTVEELASALAPLSRADLLRRDDNTAMLVINGADDYFVPQSDTLVFRGRPGTTVELFEGSRHCAFSVLPRVLPPMIGWLRQQLGLPLRPIRHVAAAAFRTTGWGPPR